MVSPSAGASLDVAAGSGVISHPGAGDGVNRLIQLPVTAAVEAMPAGAPARGFQRAGARQRRERGVVSDPAGVAEADDALRAGHRSDTGTLGKPWGKVGDDPGKLPVVADQLRLSLPHQHGHPPQLLVADLLGAAALAGTATARQAGQQGDGHRFARQGLIAIVTGAQQRLQPVDASGLP